MSGMLHDLQAGIEHVEGMREGLEDEMLFISGVDLEEDRINVVFKELLNQVSHELYPSCSKFSSPISPIMFHFVLNSEQIFIRVLVFCSVLM